MSLTLPVEFQNRMKNLLGEEWPDFLECYENDRYQALRINGLKKPSPENLLIKTFDLKDGVAWEPNGFYYREDKRPGKHPYHEMGLYYIQEPSAMSAAVLLAPQPGMRILDLCAAPGGKSTQLASALDGKGLLVSNEINPSRAKILSSNIERMGIRNCMVTSADSQKLSSYFPSFFHGILVDSPCSGEGMFRKNPEAIEEWSPENIRRCAERSIEILDNASKMLLPGGRLVYSTCTFAPEENEETISCFLNHHDDFYLEKTEAPWFSKARPEWITDITEKSADLSKAFRLWPHKLHGEGHFVAVLRRKGVLPAFVPDRSFGTEPSSFPSGTDKTSGNPKNKKKRRDLRKNSSSVMTPDEEISFKTFLNNTFLPKSDLIQMAAIRRRGEHLYLVPEWCPADSDLSGLNILRLGLHLGELKKNRFEPSLALALACSIKDVRSAADLRVTDERIPAFYRGESFPLSNDDFAGGFPDGGWVLLCADGYPCGWGKFSSGILKNHFPKGLRKT